MGALSNKVLCHYDSEHFVKILSAALVIKGEVVLQCGVDLILCRELFEQKNTLKAGKYTC